MSSALHTHSMYSLLDGYATPEENLKRASELGLKALAVTEHGNLYSACYYDKLKQKYPDVKIIYGVEFYECFDMHVQDKDSKYFHLIVLARNENGRKAINKLITKSNFEGFYYKPRIDLEAMKPYGKDLVVSSACLASKLAKEPDIDKCIQYINEYKSIFPYFYLEMQSHNHPEQAEYNQKILKLSQITNTPYIITCDSHAATKEDLKYQSRYVQIAHDSETASEVYEGCCIQSDEEIHEIMDGQIGQEAVNVGLLRTDEIADLIADVKMPFQSPQLPTFPLPKGFDNNYDYLKYLVAEGWKYRGLDKLNKEVQEKYKQRIEYELGIIHQMGFDGYFLIVWDFINYAKDNGIAVGPGRGSAAGSMVCYTLKISELDPIKYGLIFERFLNPERVSMPDIDVDFSDRGLVIDYLTRKYGESNVCQIINFSFITPVVAIKDVGKILGFQYKEMDKLSKKFTYDTFEECLDNNKELVNNNPQYQELFDIALHLSGRVKTVSCHAGGVGIVDTDINDYMPMKLGEKGEHVIQVDKRIVEEIGIIKFDLLGVQTLTMIQEIINDTGIDPYEININNPRFYNDTKPYIILNKGLTNGVFQVESAGMKDLLIRLQASNMEDLSAVLALYRPDSMGALDEYIECKHNPEKVHYIHPDMESILKDTYGQLIYQEEILDIVRKFGGRTYGGADLYRKAIGKKNIELVKKESEKLYQEIIDTGYSAELAKIISDEMSAKGGYCFNKSHSYSYAVVCFQTAYLKTYYTIYFFKALFNLNKDKAGMINKYIIDAKDFGINVTPPNINKSEMNFSISNNKILFGLSAISGIGENVANAIISERNINGAYMGLQDFIERTGVTKAQVISLIKAGAIPTKDKKICLIRYLKSLYKPLKFKSVAKAPSYATLIAEWDIDPEKYRIGLKKYDYDKEKILEVYNRKRQEAFDKQQSERFQKYIRENNKYLENEEFWEFEALQIFINDNPFCDAYRYLSRAFEDVEEGELCTIVGIIAKVQKKKDRHGKTFAYINIYSSFGLTEGIVWHSKLKEYEDLIAKGNQVAIYCQKDSDDKVIVKEMKSYYTWLNEIKKRKAVKVIHG
ncbi:DNA polymerase III subunit alpha [Mediterraneibacter sp. NSJ-55]|uniref:DNA-directed DNA polymerase n=1 Tax=Mediterraneibacter hominis TaxID=2763054 RepID=A0A923LHD3_9FIRM|nr:DNA polymerase III subunit alpha [Mediterraneibacter hominis]MBC5688086.1 DNA polymerase III subunit alpha [Mediterraneibacter hominis]